MLAPAVAAKDQHALAAHVGELGQREQALAVERRRRNARAGDADRGERVRRARARREDREPRGPSARVGRAVFDRVGGDEDRDVVRRQRVVRAAQRRRIGRRQDRDRRKDDRRAAERGDLLRESRRLSRGPRDEDAEAGERPGGLRPRRQRVDHRCRTGSRGDEPRRAAREKFVGERVPERIGRAQVVEQPRCARRA